MQFGLMAVILTRTVLIKPVFLQNHAILFLSAPTQLYSLLRRFDIHERFHRPPLRFGDKIVHMWIIGRDSYSHSLHQASFSPKSCHIVEIGSHSIVLIVT